MVDLKTLHWTELCAPKSKYIAASDAFDGPDYMFKDGQSFHLK